MKKYIWKVVILVNAADKHTKKQVQKLFRALSKISYNRKVAVLLFYCYRKNPDKEGSPFHLIIYEYKYDLETKAIKKSIFSKNKETDFGDDRTLKDFLYTINGCFPSERTLLCTWDHGSGFGVFGDAESTPFEHQNSLAGDLYDFGPVLDNEKPLLTGKDSKQIKITFFQPRLDRKGNYKETKDPRIFTRRKDCRAFEIPKEYSSLEEYILKQNITVFVNSILTNDELATSIDYGFGKVDVLLMMNCMMQLIDTGYSFKNNANVLIAAQTGINWAGFDICGIINLLNKSPQVSDYNIAKFSLDSLKDHFKKSKISKAYESIVVSAVFPQYIENLKNSIDKLALVLIESSTDKFNQLIEIRRNMKDISSLSGAGWKPDVYTYIDLLDFVNELSSKSLIEEDLLLEIKQGLFKYLFYAKRGQKYERQNSDVNLANGISLFFPIEKTSFEVVGLYPWFYKDPTHQCAFAKNSKWANLINKVNEKITSS